jgi:hypothetical protein
METKMKALTKLAVASILALSAVAPALAAEEDTLLERNTYLYTADARPIVRHAQHDRANTHRGVEAFASAPAKTTVYTRDFGIGSQS